MKITQIATDAITTLLTRANGGTEATRIDMHIVDRLIVGIPFPGDGDGRDKMLVAIDEDGRFDVVIGIATHWTTLVHDKLRPALTPGGELIFIGRHAGRKIWFWVEDGRFHCDVGSPLLSVAQEQEAMAAFAAMFAMLQVEVA